MTTLFKGTLYAKPFLKWAGGKGQLIPAIEKALPNNIAQRKTLTYIEPFAGSGAVLLWILQKYPNIKRAVLNDINSDLTKAYITVKETPGALIEALQKIQSNYYKLRSLKEKKLFYLEKREEFNSCNLTLLNNAVLFIFLNKTCFNGLYRVNSSNKFNVPFGKHDKPKICDPDTIIADSNILKKVKILNGDYQNTLKYATADTFFYFDPPYRPLNKTSFFTAYAKDIFDDAEQNRLKQFSDSLTDKGYQWLLSNSDPKNFDPNDSFFENLYSGEGVYIGKVKAKRAINSKGTKRGEITELMISNYEKPAGNL